MRFAWKNNDSTVISCLKPMLMLLLIAHAASASAVSATDCTQEQANFIEAYINSIISPEAQESMRNRGSYVQERVAEARQYATKEKIPWHINDANGLKPGTDTRGATDYMENEIKQNQEMVDSFKTKPWAGMGDRRFSIWTYKENVARLRMEICFLSLRSREGSSKTPVTSTAPADCSAQNTEAANQEISDIDNKLEAFSTSPEGQQTGTATPALQVVMWATDAQAKIIRKYCPASAGFKERLAELEAAFKGAQQACRQIQSSPEVCVPVAPQ